MTWDRLIRSSSCQTGSLAAARAIIAAVEEAERRIQQNPTTYPLHASLLSDITAIMVQQARDAMERTGDLVGEALACVGSRSQDDADALSSELKKHLIGEPTDHRAIISALDAKRYGLPVKTADPSSDQWQAVWRLWTKYLVMGSAYVYEGELASQIAEPVPPTPTE